MRRLASPKWAVTASLSALALLVVTARDAVTQVQTTLPAFVGLQTATPGAPQTGHSNISGTSKVGGFRLGDTATTGQVLTTNASGVGTWQPLPGLSLPFSAQVTVNGVGNSVFYVRNTSSDGQTYGHHGDAASNNDNSAGVWGTSSGGTAWVSGVRGESFSINGRGVIGLATAAGGQTYGGYFQSSSPNGYGVFGNGGLYGGYFLANNASSTGVYGHGGSYGGHFYSFDPSGTGVYGVAASFGGIAVRGEARGTTGNNWGGHFVATGQGIGVAAEGGAAGGTFRARDIAGQAVYAVADGTVGTGVLGLASASNGGAYGGSFTSAGLSGTGVSGSASSATGVNYGGRFQSNSPAGYGVYADGAGTGVWRQPLDPVSLAGWHHKTVCANAGTVGPPFAKHRVGAAVRSERVGFCYATSTRPGPGRLGQGLRSPASDGLQVGVRGEAARA